jgi:hypothetical protein
MPVVRHVMVPLVAVGPARQQVPFQCKYLRMNGIVPPASQGKSD